MSSGCTGAAVPYFVDSEMWFQQLQKYKYGWVEDGVTAGWITGATNCDYCAFMAYGNEAGTYYNEFPLVTLNHSSSVDSYRIERAGSNNYFRAWFGSFSGATSNLGFWSTRGFEVGGEVGTPYGAADTFDMNAYALNSSGTTVSLPSPQTTHVYSGSNLHGGASGSYQWTWWIT